MYKTNETLGSNLATLLLGIFCPGAVDHLVKMSVVGSVGFINTRLYLQPFPWVELKQEAAKVEQPDRPYRHVLVKPVHAHGLHHGRVRAELLWRLPGRLPRHRVVEVGPTASLIHQLLPV